MENKCYFCPQLISEHDKVPIILGAKTQYICVACDDRLVSYAQDEQAAETYE